MKILLLNPYVDATHEAVRAFQRKGIGLLLSADAIEAWHMLLLHGTTVDLAVIHREGVGGTGEPGFKFISQLKQDPAQLDLPYVITSEKWNDEKFAEHQSTPQGANAYLKYPFAGDDLIQILEAVLGVGESQQEASPFRSSSKQIEAPVPEPVSQKKKPTLEDAAPIFQRPEMSGRSEDQSEGQIRLEAPEVDFEVEVKSEEVSPPEAFSQNVFEAPAVFKQEISPATAEVPKIPQISQIALDPPILDPVAEQEMPYLFTQAGAQQSLQFHQPVGDAVVPGGAAQAPDLETLKKYLLLREQDVAALSTQLKSARDQVVALEDLVRMERARNVELNHTVEEFKQRLNEFEKERAVEIEILQNDLNELRFQTKSKADKARVMEVKVREATDETARLKERVRADIRKIRVREKELENRLEILKRDSEALIAARENKIIELKRKVDLLEFNIDILQDQYACEKESMAKTREKLQKAGQAVRVASSILEETSSRSEERAPETPEDQAAS